MIISQAITNTNEGSPTRGDLAYACVRNQSQAHSLMLRAVKDSGLSQKELARRTGIDEATLSRALSRPRNIELNTLSKLLYAASGAYLSLSSFVPTQPAESPMYLATKTTNKFVSSVFGTFTYRSLLSSTAKLPNELSTAASDINFSDGVTAVSESTLIKGKVYA